MTAPGLEAIVEHGEGGALHVLSPAVGLYGSAPSVGEILVGGSKVGRLTRLGRTVDLRLPAGAAGRVAERGLTQHREAVEHGAELLRLVPVDADGVIGDAAGPAAAQGHDIPEGTHAVTSPTRGMFYRRARPDAPAYVEAGQVIETGATLALVEVMKCFTAIKYGGEGMPARAAVVEVRPEDGAEVEVDQVLFVVRPT